MTNYALEDNKGSGTVIASIAAKKTETILMDIGAQIIDKFLGTDISVPIYLFRGGFYGRTNFTPTIT